MHINVINPNQYVVSDWYGWRTRNTRRVTTVTETTEELDKKGKTVRKTVVTTTTEEIIGTPYTPTIQYSNTPTYSITAAGRLQAA